MLLDQIFYYAGVITVDAFVILNTVRTSNFISKFIYKRLNSFAGAHSTKDFSEQEKSDNIFDSIEYID